MFTFTLNQIVLAILTSFGLGYLVASLIITRHWTAPPTHLPKSGGIRHVTH